jgi:surface glycoprotein (TIGR04207 family)
MARADSRKKIRAIFFAVLMILWLFAGTIGFAGGVEAKTDNGSISETTTIEYSSTGNCDGTNGYKLCVGRVSLSDDVAEPGDEISVKVTIENRGNKLGTTKVSRGVENPDGTRNYKEKTYYDIPAGGSKTRTFYYTVPDPAPSGEYSFTIDVYTPPGEHMFDTTGFNYDFVVNNPPSISRKDPTNFQLSIKEGSGQRFEVGISDPDGNLRNVDWYVDGDFETSNSVSGSTDTDTFSKSFNNEGTYLIEAYAYDQEGTGDESITWEVTVDSNEPPVIERDYPEFSTSIKTGSSVKLGVDISDPDGNLRNVDWYVDGNFETSNSVSGSTDTDTFSKSFNNEGTYLIEAHVYDEEGTEDGSIAWEVTAAEPKTDAEITEFNSPSGNYFRGDDVNLGITIKNTGETRHEFFVGYSVVDEKGNEYNNSDSTGKEIELAPGESESASLSWVVPKTAPTESYDIVSAVWAENDPDNLQSQLDRREKTDQIQVERKEAEARLRDFNVNTGEYVPGDRVEATVKVDNTGSTEDQFYVGYSLIGPGGKEYNNSGATDVPVTLSPNESEFIELSWSVPKSALTGQYRPITAVWKNKQSGGNLSDRLDRTEGEETVTIDNVNKWSSQLKIESTWSSSANESFFAALRVDNLNETSATVGSNKLSADHELTLGSEAGGFGAAKAQATGVAASEAVWSPQNSGEYVIETQYDTQGRVVHNHVEVMANLGPTTKAITSADTTIAVYDLTAEEEVTVNQVQEINTVSPSKEEAVTEFFTELSTNIFSIVISKLKVGSKVAGTVVQPKTSPVKNWILGKLVGKVSSGVPSMATKAVVLEDKNVDRKISDEKSIKTSKFEAQKDHKYLIIIKTSGNTYASGTAGPLAQSELIFNQKIHNISAKPASGDTKPPELSAGSIQKTVPRESVTIPINIEDDTVGQNEYSYRVISENKNGEWTQWSKTNESKLDVTVELSEGNNKIQIRARDQTGNIQPEYVEKIVNSDTEAPEISLNEEINSNNKAMISVNSDELLNKVILEYKKTQEPSWTTWKRLRESATVEFDRTGEYTIRARGIDRAGNTGGWKQIEINTSKRNSDIPKLGFKNITSPDSVEIGNGFDISTGVTNQGDSGREEIELRIDGKTLATKKVNVSSNSNTKITFKDVVIVNQGINTIDFFTDTDHATVQIKAKNNGTDQPGETDQSSNVVEDFESNTPLSNWSTNAGFVGGSTTRAYSGGQSVHANNVCGFNCHPDPLATLTPEAIKQGEQIESISYYWYENRISYGGALSVYNSEGEHIAGTATANPQWHVWSATREKNMPETHGWGLDIYQGDGYERWVHTTINFNWQEGTVTYIFRDTKSGTTRSKVVSLPENTTHDVASVQFRDYSGAIGSNDNIAGGSIDHYWDNLTVTGHSNDSGGDSESPDPVTEVTAQNGVAMHGGFAYVVENDNILKFNMSTQSIVDKYSAPDGRPDGLAYGDESLWFVDGVDGNFDGEIIELNPNSGEVRSRITVDYDPSGVAFSDGVLWVTDVTTNNIRKYRPGGTQTATFDVAEVTGSTGPSGLAHLDGSLWLGTREGGLYEFATNGTLVQEADTRSTGYTGLGANKSALVGPNKSGSLTVLQRTEVTKNSDNELYITMSSDVVTANNSSDITLTVLDSEAGSPIPNTRVESPALGVVETTNTTGTATVSLVDPEPGEYNLSFSANGFIDTTKTLTVTKVDSGKPVITEYANEENIIDTGGLLQAIADWRSGEVDTSILLEVINNWRSRDPVI